MSREAAYAFMLTGAAKGVTVKNMTNYTDITPSKKEIAAYQFLLREKNIEYGSLHDPKKQKNPEGTIRELEKNDKKMRH